MPLGGYINNQSKIVIIYKQKHRFLALGYNFQLGELSILHRTIAVM
jgi:hypothetical protein